MFNVEIVGTGSYLPGEPISNEQLAAVFGREVFWLCEMLGACHRHFAIDLDSLALRPGETNADMATKAAQRALLDAEVEPHSIDLIVMATSTPDYPFPATALFVQEQLGIPSCTVMELRAGCSGMAQAFVIATHLLASGTAHRALLIGSELNSPFISLADRTDRGFEKDFLVSLAMFGDGAGAIVLSGDAERRGVLDCAAWSISTGRPPGMILRTGGALAPGGYPRQDSSLAGEPIFHHDYQAILTHAPELIVSACDWLRDERGYDFSTVRYFIGPQASGHLIDLTARQLDLPAERVVSDFARAGNTVSASIYLALDRLNQTGQLHPDDRIVLLPAEATKWIYGAVGLRWTKGGKP